MVMFMFNRITIEHNKVVREKTNEQKRSEYYKSYNKYRNETASEYVKFYKSRKWVNMRAFVMAQNNWICQHCLMNDYVVHADVVDHIVPTRVDWSKRLELTNLQSLCDSCHKVKTLEDKKKYGL